MEDDKKKVLKKQIERKVTIYQSLIVVAFFAILVVANILLYDDNLYINFFKIETVGILWTIIGFAFTIYCFIVPKLSKTVNLLNRMEKCIGLELYVQMISKKEYLKIKRIEMFINLLKVFIFSSLAFLGILTFNVLRAVEITNEVAIMLNILSNLIITFVFVIYFIIISLGQNQFDATSGIDDETLDELRKAIKTMEGWEQEIQTQAPTTTEHNDTIEKTSEEEKDGKDGNAK